MLYVVVLNYSKQHAPYIDYAVFFQQWKAPLLCISYFNPYNLIAEEYSKFFERINFANSFGKSSKQLH